MMIWGGAGEHTYHLYLLTRDEVLEGESAGGKVILQAIPDAAVFIAGIYLDFRIDKFDTIAQTSCVGRRPFQNIASSGMVCGALL